MFNTEGISYELLPAQGRLTRDEFAKKVLSATATLSDLSNEFAFFSHGALLDIGNLDVDPIQHWLNNQSRNDIVVGPLGFDFPVLQGLPVYSNVLWFCERTDAWVGLKRHLSGLVGWQPERQRIWLSRLYELDMPDLLQLQQAAVLPSNLKSVRVSLFLPSTNHTDYRASLRNNQLIVDRFPPDKRIVTLGALYAAKTNILAAEEVRNQETHESS